jgi:hypothetical protein
MLEIANPMVEIASSYIDSVILVAFVFAISLFLGFALNGKSRRTRLLFNLLGMLFIAVAGLEKIGWTVRPWSTGSPAEAWNDLLFRVIFLVGLGLVLVSWTMAFLEARPRGREERHGEPRPAEHQVSNV